MEFLRRLLKQNTAPEQTMPPPKGGHSQRSGRRISGYSRLIILVGILLIGSLWTYVSYQITADYDRTIAEASRETMNLAKAFEEHVRRLLADADKDLLNLKSAYEQGGMSSAVFAAYADNAAKDPSRNLVALLNDQGVVVDSRIIATSGASRVDREYFRVHRDTDTNKLQIGKPIIGRIGGQASIPLTRRVNKPDGSFGGIVYIGLKVDYFSQYYQKIELGQDQLIALTGLDGFTRARQAGNGVEAGQDARGSVLWEKVQAGHLYASYQTKNIFDGSTRLISHRVMSDYPLIVIVAKSRQVALVGYQQRKQGYNAGALLISLVILVVCRLLVTRHEKLVMQHQELLAQEQRMLAQNQELLAKEEELVKYRDNLQTLVEERTRELSDQARLLNLAHDYIMVHGPDGKIIYWNQGAESGYGWLAAETIGQAPRRLLKTRSPASPESILDSLLTSGYWEGELTQTRKDGKEIIVQSHQTLHRDAVGDPVSIMEINHDITAQKKYETEMARLDRLNIIGEMAAGIGHEVRNPLTTVRGYLQRFDRQAAFAEYREPLALMIEELDRANGIITEFLSLAKNKTVILSSTDLNTVIRGLFPLLQADAFRRGSAIELELGDIPAVQADEKELRQCILNLVGNGLDAMPAGGKVTIGTAAAGDRVGMTVRDHGSGIPPAIKEKIGTPFLSTKENGTGLGLPVCFRIAQRHNATIEVDTGPAGTAVHFIFNPPKHTG